MNTRAHARFAQHFGPTALLLPPLPAGVPEAIATLGALGWLTLDSVLIAHRLWCRANPEQAKAPAAGALPELANALPTPEAINLNTLDPAWLAVLTCAMALDAPSHGRVAFGIGKPNEPPNDEAADLWPDARVTWAAPSTLRTALLSSGVVSEGTDAAEAAPPFAIETGATPEDTVVLYARRYLRAERDVAVRLRQRAEGAARLPAPGDEMCRRAVALTTWTSSDGGGSPNPRQALAAATAVGMPFFALVGGPGTGKTSTLRAALTMQALQCLDANPGAALPQVALAAPTGKAAARMREALNKDTEQYHRQLQRAGVSDADRIRIQAWLTDLTPSTIHKLIGAAPGRAPRFGPSSPLNVDLVVLDETSMVDLELMRRLLLALPADALLWVLGDRQQLASVDVGSVLADISRGLWDADVRSTHPRAQAAAAGVARHLAVDSDLLQLPSSAGRQHPLAACLVELTESHRFKVTTVIGKFALTLVREPDTPKNAMVAFESMNEEKWRHREHPLPNQRARGHDDTIDWLASGYSALVETLSSASATPYANLAAWHVALLHSLDTHRVLTARRGSIWGVEALNQELQKALRARVGRSRTVPSQPWVGLPVMVLRNDYELDVRNGDIGICCVEKIDPARGLAGAWKAASDVVFLKGVDTQGSAGGSELRYVPLAQLSAWEPALAMTVHKSQGSEFDTVTVVVAPSAQRLLTRELMYTGITRAKKEVRLLGDRQTLVEALQRTVPSGSLLGTRLWG